MSKTFNGPNCFATRKRFVGSEDCNYPNLPGTTRLSHRLVWVYLISVHSFFKKESNQRKLSPLLTTLRFAAGNLIPGFRPAHGRTPGAPKALWSNSCRESDVEVLSGTCRSKPPDEPPESGVARRAGSGAGSDAALCFACARIHPHPTPLHHLWGRGVG